MAPNMEDVLKKLGWNDGFQIPIANAENQALEEEVAKLSLQRSKAKNLLDNVSGRLESLGNHFKYVSLENEQNQRLLTAHKQQLESEQNNYYTKKAEKERTEQELKELKKRLKELNEKCEMKKTELARGVSKVDKLKIETNWDEEAIKAWEESLKKRDDDNELIKKFSMEDERKFNELEARRQQLQSEYIVRSQCIEKMVSDLNNYENIMERTGKVIKQQISERDTLIHQWKESVRTLQRRDQDIAKCEDMLLENHEIIEKQKDKLDEQNGYLLNEQNNNHELEREIECLNAYNSRSRKDLNDLIQYNLLLYSELNTNKRTLASISNRLENVRIKGKKLTEEISTKEYIVQTAQDQLAQMKEKLKDVTNKSMSAKDRIRHLELLLEYEERQNKVLHSDRENVQKSIYRLQKELEDNKVKAKDLDVLIHGCKISINKLKKYNETIGIDLENRKENIYEIEFTIDSLEQELDSIENDGKNEDFFSEKEERTANLEKILAEQTDIKNLLQDQVNKMQYDMKIIISTVTQDKEILENLRNKCEHQILFCEIGKKQVAAIKQTTQERQVEENMIQLRIKQIEKDMKKQEKSIFSLQKFKLGLEQAMKQRQVEISTRRDILFVKRRNLDEDRGRLKADMSIRNYKIEQLQKKYHIALMCLGQTEDGQPITITHFKIKTAQEKFLLKQEGDCLDNKIKTAEKEIVAMENTLKVVNSTNNAFKQSLAPVLDDDVEIREMKLLENELRDVEVKIRKHKKDLTKKRQELKDLQNMLVEVQAREIDVKQNIEASNEEYLSIEKQVVSKNEKLKRAECQLKKVEKTVSKKSAEKFERDFEIRQLKDANNASLQQLVAISLSHQEVAPLISRYSSEHNIELPKRKITPSTSSESSFLTISSCSSKHDDNSSGRSSEHSTPSVNKITLCFDI